MAGDDGRERASHRGWELHLMRALPRIIRPAAAMGKVPFVLANNMTSDTAPPPNVAFADGDLGVGYEAFRAFDGSTSTFWSGPAGAGYYVRRDVGAENAFILTSYAVTSNNGSSYVSGWNIQGSNDASSWATVDSQSGIVFTTPQQRQLFTCSSPGATPFRYYRLITTTVFGFGIICELEFNP